MWFALFTHDFLTHNQDGRAWEGGIIVNRFPLAPPNYPPAPFVFVLSLTFEQANPFWPHVTTNCLKHFHKPALDRTGWSAPSVPVPSFSCKSPTSVSSPVLFVQTACGWPAGDRQVDRHVDRMCRWTSRSYWPTHLQTMSCMKSARNMDNIGKLRNEWTARMNQKNDRMMTGQPHADVQTARIWPLFFMERRV